MKTSFVFNGLIDAALSAKGFTGEQKAKAQQAIEAHLNSFKASKETWKRGNVKEVKKTADAQFKESGEIEYSGERNIVSSFVQYHDKVGSLASRAEKMGCVVSVAEIPPVYNDWLAKFSTKGERNQQAAAERKPKAKGDKGEGNGTPARETAVKV